MNYNFETVAAQIVANYLTAAVDKSITNQCPIVTFFDPMSVEESDRIIAMAPSGANDAALPGNAEMMVEILVKSRWNQKTIAADFTTHFNRVNAVRGALFIEDLADSIRTYGSLPADMGLSAVKNRREFATNVYTSNFIASETTIRVELFAIADQGQLPP